MEYNFTYRQMPYEIDIEKEATNLERKMYIIKRTVL